jgi:hypothetical protein
MAEVQRSAPGGQRETQRADSPRRDEATAEAESQAVPAVGPAMVHALGRVDAPMRAALLAQMNRTQGNAFVQRLVQQSVMPVQRAPAAPAAKPAPTGPAVAFKTPSDIANGTLSEFDEYARKQADWHTDPALSASEIKDFRTVLEFARSKPINVLGACKDMKVQALIDTGLTGDILKHLRSYSRAVPGTAPTAHVKAIDDVTKAVAWGEALEKLEASPGGPTIKVILPFGQSKDWLDELVTAGEVDSFATYARTAHPLLHADNGKEIESYLAMIKTDGVNPATFVGKLHGVKNFHRFERKALDKLVANEADTSRARPLTLMLQSAFDHNGAFHRDPNVSEAVVNPVNLTLVIEGAASLAALGAEVQAIAKKYGQGNKIHQLMLSGHGDATSMELTGTLDKKGNQTSGGDLDLRKNKARTTAFLRSMLGAMDKSADTQIVLNACLTASNEVNKDLSKDPRVAKAQILGALRNDPSLASQLSRMAGPGRSVIGSNASFGQIHLIDPVTGKLTMKSDTDPALVGSKLDYIEQGTDPSGVMRAVVEVWALDNAACLAKVKTRAGGGAGGDWNGAIIQTLLKMVDASPTNAQLMNRLAFFAEPLSLMEEEQFQKVSFIAPFRGSFSAAQFDTIMAGVIAQADNRRKLILTQVWQKSAPAKGADFMAALDTFATVEDVTELVDLGFLGKDLARLLTAGSLSAQIKLALLGVLGKVDSSCRAFLRGRSLPARAFDAGDDVPGKLKGSPLTETQVLERIGVITPGGGPVTAGGKPTPNVDLDGDGVNDFFVTPDTRRGIVRSKATSIRARPARGAVIGVATRKTELNIIGRAEGWFAVEFGARTGFANPTEVRLEASP